jgi:hypothetical protein
MNDKSISNLLDNLQAWNSQQLWDNLDMIESCKHILMSQTYFTDPDANKTAITDIEVYRRVMINLCHTDLRIKACKYNINDYRLG